HWMSGTGDPDFEDQQQLERAPLEQKQLREWLLKPRSDDFFYEDDWAVLCRDRFRTAFRALRALAQDDHWPAERWSEALQVWSEKKHLKLSWRLVAPVLGSASNDTLVSIAHSVTWWLQAVTKVTAVDELVLLELCRHLLVLEYEDSPDNEHPTQRAINHPIGHITQALL